jgi:hypothetical protein
MQNRQDTFAEFLKVNASEATKELFEPILWLKSVLTRLLVLLIPIRFPRNKKK